MKFLTTVLVSLPIGLIVRYSLSLQNEGSVQLLVDNSVIYALERHNAQILYVHC